MTDLLKDIRFGVRILLKRPGTSALAVVALGLGIGLTTTMFSIVQAAFLRGLPFHESERLQHIGRVTPEMGPNDSAQSIPLHDFVDWRRSQQSFEDLGAFTNRAANVTGGLAPERYRASAVTPNMLRILRVAPVAGRDFTDADAEPGAPPTAIVSHRVWMSQFEGDPDFVGQLVRINGVPTTIIGVMPPRFGFPQTQDIWLPLTITLDPKRGAGSFVTVFGRLKPDASRSRASAEMTAIADRLAAEYPENAGMGARIVPYIRRFIGNEPIRALSTMLGAVFGVMLIACANVANLQFARAAERTKEVAVRTALGAGRGRIVRQMLIEGLLLSTAGAGVGLAMAAVGSMLFNRAIVDTNPPFWIHVYLDRTVLAFAGLLAIVAALAASLLPALRATTQDVHAVLKDEGRANTGLRMGRLGRSLIVVEVLLSCCLLIVSGLMIKSVVTIGRITYPYATEDIFVAGIAPNESAYVGATARAQLAGRLETALAAVPGVRDVALANGTPENTGGGPFVIEGQTYARPEDRPSTRRLNVSARFFDVLRIKVTRGRAFTSADVAGSLPVAIVSEDFARKYFPNGDALDRRLRFGSDAQAPLWTIVGVVPRLVASGGPASRVAEQAEIVFVPLAQAPEGSLTVLASTAANPLALTTPVRRVLQTIDQDLALSAPNTLAGSYYQRTWAFRVFGTLFMSFGLAALVLAAAGLYGVLAFSVRRRTQEIGVRMALGADRRGILRMVIWQGMSRVGLGIVLGLVPAWWLAGLMQILLFDVTRTDPTVFATTIGALAGAGLLASVVPALRAASVDPLKALRHD